MLQAFGLAVLMAKAGVPISAAPPARLPPFSMVLADIGDEQSLFASLSTFSGHLRRIQVICPGTTDGARRPVQELQLLKCWRMIRDLSWAQSSASLSHIHGGAGTSRRMADGKALVLLDEVDHRPGRNATPGDTAAAEKDTPTMCRSVLSCMLFTCAFSMQALRREADGKALVLLDEVGTGTDPAEGAALGIALLRALAAGGARGAAFTMASTHHRWSVSLFRSRREHTCKWCTP